jgi:nucleoside diphosphate kinase
LEEKNLEQTYMMIKPEIVADDDQKIGDILAMVQKNGLIIMYVCSNSYSSRWLRSVLPKFL